MKRYVVWATSDPGNPTIVTAANMEAARQMLADGLGISFAEVEARVFIQGDERLEQG